MNLPALTFITFFAIGALLAPLQNQALQPDPQIRYGIEWTFTNKQIIKEGKQAGNYQIATKSNARVRDKMTNAFLRKCRNCILEARPNSVYESEPTYRIWFTSDKYIEIAVDPWVIEINASPMSTSEFIENQEFLERVFSIAEKSGVAAHERIGGGHVHIDFAKAFGESELAARNFIVDMINHPELAMGALGKDYLNAAPLAMLSKKQRQAFVKALANFDAKQISFDTFMQVINSEVYSNSYDAFDPFPSEKYQAVNLRRAHSSSTPRTIELRFFRPPKTFDEHMLVLSLLEARIEFINKLKHPVPYNDKSLSPGKVSDQSVAETFQRFVEQTGSNVETFKSLVPAKIQQYISPTSALRCRNIWRQP